MWFYGRVGRCGCGVLGLRRPLFDGEPICGSCAKGRRQQRARTARETHEIATGLSQIPLTPAEQAARKLWLRSNGERHRDDRASFASQQYGWGSDDGDDSVVHLRAASRKVPVATNVVLPAEVSAELKHDAARQAKIEIEVMTSRDEHGDMSRLAGPERFADVWGEDSPEPEC